jgi:tetratricopeptide (TPR) repeat protein
MKTFKSDFWMGLFWICVPLAMLVFGVHLWETLQWNWISLRLLKGQEVTVPVSPKVCSHEWLVGMVAGHNGDLVSQRQAFKLVLSCTDDYLSLMQVVLPEDQELAQLSTQQYPENSKAWSWLGRASLLTDHYRSRQAYLRTVVLDPGDGFAWYELGWNYEQSSEFKLAGEAYLNGCLNGDYGYFCCWSAGRMMEKMGYLQQAIDYYRLSQWDQSLERAKDLEEQLKY